MDNNELMAQVIGLFKEQSQTLSKQISGIYERLDAIESDVAGARLDIENKIGQRIDVLFDGYKLTHEKQWEQEHEIEAMKSKIQALELQIQAINQKLA